MCVIFVLVNFVYETHPIYDYLVFPDKEDLKSNKDEKYFSILFLKTMRDREPVI